MTASTPRIFVAGHNGMVGSAIVRALLVSGVSPVNIITRSRAELDLTSQQGVNDLFTQEKPDQVYMAAARVGGIHANNTYPAEFIYDNLMVQANVIHAAHRHGRIWRSAAAELCNLPINRYLETGVQILARRATTTDNHCFAMVLKTRVLCLRIPSPNK